MLSPYSNISSYLKNILTQYIFWNLKYKAVCNKSLNDIPILQYQYGYSWEFIIKKNSKDEQRIY